MEPAAWFLFVKGIRHSCQKRIPAHFKMVRRNGALSKKFGQLPKFTPSTIPTVPRLNPKNLSGTRGISGVVEPKETVWNLWNHCVFQPEEPVWSCGVFQPEEPVWSCGTSGVVEPKESVWDLWNQWRGFCS